jgi:hypothetical protein
VNSTARNVLIVLALAAAVAFVPGGGLGAGLVGELFSVIFLGGLAWFAGRLYLEHRTTIYSLGDRGRLILYGSIGLAVLTVTATPRLWATGPGTIVWIVLIAAASYGLFAVYRSQQQY